MADSFTANLNLRMPEVGAANNSWGGVAGLNNDLGLIDAIFAPGGNGTPVGLNIGTGKTLDARSGTLLARNDLFVLSDGADPTKKARIGVSNVPTGTQQDYFFPAQPDTLVGLVNPQNLSNKTTADPPAGAVTQALVSAKYVKDAIAAAVAAIPPAATQFDTGDLMPSAAATKSGWVKLNGGTIGNTGSGAALADPTAQALFNLFWAVNTNAWPINGGRGASAAADWASTTPYKTITLPDASGMALVGIGGAVALAKLFDTKGEATHLLTVAEMPSHSHTVTPNVQRGLNGGGGQTGGGSVMLDQFTSLGVTDAAGGGAAHNNVQPSVGVVYWIKL